MNGLINRHLIKEMKETDLSESLIDSFPTDVTVSRDHSSAGNKEAWVFEAVITGCQTFTYIWVYSVVDMGLIF